MTITTKINMIIIVYNKTIYICISLAYTLYTIHTHGRYMYVQVYIKIYIYRRMHCLSNKHVLPLTACISPVWSDCTMLITMGPMWSNHFSSQRPSAEIPDPVFLIWSTGSVFVREKDIAHISQIDALRCCPAMILILPIWDLWIDPLPRSYYWLLLSIPTLWSQLCVDPHARVNHGWADGKGLKLVRCDV